MGIRDDILALDPGKNTGWVILSRNEDNEYRISRMGTTRSKEELHEFLATQNPSTIVAEDYYIRAGKAAGGYAHQWSDGIALRIIGAIEYHATSRAIPLVMQQAAIKPVAAGWTGLPYVKGKKDMHHMDAALHGYYYCIKEGLTKPFSDQKKG